nr:branched-chain amino acid ABC transporter permease [Mangrovitalea sediminis]
MNRIAWITVIVLGLLAPFAVYPVLMMELLCFALFACAFNLLLGYSGLLSFGHAAFFGGAAYICGYAVTAWHLGPLQGILIGTAFAGGLGLVFGVLAIRRQGIYFAMITLALAQIIFFLCLKMPFTGGEDGLQGVPRGMLFGFIDLNKPLNMYYTVFAIFMICFWLIWRAVNSPFGQVLSAIRENEARAISLGYSVERIKLLAFVLSATLAGTAGATKSIVFQTASLTDVSWHTSGEVILMTLVGGMGTLLGPVVGAFTIVGLQHELSSIGSWVTVIIGLTFIVCVLVFRRGMVGELTRLWKRSF